LGFSLQSQSLTANSVSSSQQAQIWVASNGDVSITCSPGPCIPPPSSDPIIYWTSEYRTLELNGGWSYDTRNRALFANRGTRHSLGISATVPGSEVEFIYMNYRYNQYIPFTRYFTFAFNGNLGYGQAFGDTTSVPPYKNFYAGGPDSVRGFKENSLGPLDSLNNPYGGNLLVVGQAELILPIPASWQSRSRFVLFYDIGNTFSTEDIIWYEADRITQLPDDFYAFKFNNLRQSFGIAAQWLAPLGLFKFSYGIPVNEFEGGNGILPDQVENFQFTIGGAF
jgi:outer membrane protein insertion porin family